MLELPESHTLARQCAETLRGKRIARVIANTSPHRLAFFHNDPGGYDSLLAGTTIDGATARGGMVEIATDDRRLVFGDGANLRYYADPARVPAKHQLAVQFADDSVLVVTVQMYGALWAFVDGTLDNIYYRVAAEKPTPLTDAFDLAYFENIRVASKPTLSAKAFLATEQRIPGLGNGVLQDILFNAQINPRTRIGRLDENDFVRLFGSVKQTLRKMTDCGGRDTEIDLFGEQGGYRTLLSSKTLSFPCPRCGGSVQREAYLGGNVYFCPTCQPVGN